MNAQLRSALLAGLFAAVSTLPALAGPNTGGVLILHWNPSLNASCETQGSFCEQSNLARCEDAITRYDGGGSGNECATLFVLAAFLGPARLVGVTFGLDYNADSITIAQHASCADFEIATSGWPAPGTGTALAFGAPRTTRLVELYEMVALKYDPSPQTVRLTPHPTQGGWFGDDSTPSHLDPVVDYGRMGFDMNGRLPCPLASGACCLPDGSCEQRLPGDCVGPGESYHGDGTDCAPNLCPPVFGACCLITGSCVLTQMEPCIAEQGTFHGYGVDCDAANCPPGGGCCLPSGVCFVLTDEECQNRQGIFFGPHVPCDAEPCVGRGACCIDQLCDIRTESDCAAHGGSYRGDGSICRTNTCTGFGGCAGPIASGVASNEAASVGIGEGTLVGQRGDLGCGTLNINSDSSYENGYAWQYGGIAPPDFGAFAECFSGASALVCSAVFDLTQVGFGDGQLTDVYVWSDGGGCPGNVVCVRTVPNMGPIAFWPSVSRHVIPLADCCVDGDFWVGFWGNWPGQIAPWYVGADLDGFGGCPLTNIAPGIGFPTGWQNVSVSWGPTRALGIGCETTSCAPTATEKMSWGKVKTLYRQREKPAR